jgi:predicted AlkP superfamily phosphohydrolase/phosphomutase
MKRLCRAGARGRLRAVDIKSRDGRGYSPIHRARQLFAGEGARATRFLLIALIFLPALAHAYAGPGAGFAVLSSFWAIFVAFLYSFYALMTWPFRQLFRFLRRRNAYGKATFERAVILGFDGMDPDLADRFMKEGRLPNLVKLRDKGTFSKLRTTFPAISPVAWSTFLTGVNPGKHNIYDFLARDTSNYLPYLSSADIKGPKRHIKIGKYSIPFGKTEIKAMRKGTPFWHWLGDAGIFSSVIRVPVTFPPEKFQGVLLSGMCVPDLKGSQGTFCLCTTRASNDKFREGGVRVPIERKNGVCRSYVPGPDNPLLEKGGELRVDFEIRPELGSKQARFVVGSEKFTLKVGEYSEWLPAEFKAGMGFTAHGICRFYLKELSPEVEIYVTPVNIDPGHPDLPISHPVTYSIYLAKLLGPYATLGLAEDTWALNEHVLDDNAFLAQAYGNHEDRERMLFDALDKTKQGLCTCVFDTTDRVQHMFWRYLEEDHPAARDVPHSQHPQVIQDLYERMDRLIGRVMEKIDDDTLLLVISDHGFKSFARCMNLNAWLHQNRERRLVRRRGLVAHPRLHHGPQRTLSECQRPREAGNCGSVRSRRVERRAAKEAEWSGRSSVWRGGDHGRVYCGQCLSRALYGKLAGPYCGLRSRLSRLVGLGDGQSYRTDFRGQYQGMERRPLHRPTAGSWSAVFQPQVH